MTSSTNPTNRPWRHVELDVRGAVPPGLSGRLMGLGLDGVVHSVHVHGGAVAYVARRVRPSIALPRLVAFEGSILAFGDDCSVHELSTDVDALRRVDLAGHGRELATAPTYDSPTGELHFVALDSDGTQTHVVVSAGALTRRSRTIIDAPRGIRGLALGRDDAVFVADGTVGVAPRNGEARTTWIATQAPAPHPIHARRTADAVVLLVLTPSLERWILHPGSVAIERDVVDTTARHVARTGGGDVDGAPRYVWSTGDATISRHDIAESLATHVNLAPSVPGDLIVVADASRPGTTDGGWLVVVLHDASTATADIQVIGLADIAAPAVATIRISRSVQLGFRCEWLPSTVH